MKGSNRSDLIKRVAKEHKSLNSKDVEMGVKQIFEIISHALSQGQRVELRGFGSFNLHFRKPQTGRNPRTGRSVEVSGRYVPRFKAGVELRRRVDNVGEEDQ